MAERKPGPVKPPTIDLTAREVAPEEAAARPRVRTSRSRPAAETPTPAPAETAEPAAEAAADTAAPPEAAAEPPVEPSELPPRRASDSVGEPPEPPPGPPEALPPEPAPVAVQPWGAILAAIVAGAFLGTALTYLLSTFAPLPTNAPVIADPSADLAAHEQRLNALESSNAALADEAKRTETSLGATIAQLDAGLADLRKSIADAQAATAPADDLAAIRTQLATLSDRLDAVAAGASSPDAEALARTIAGLQAAVTAVQTQVADLQAGGGATQTTLDALEGNVDELRQALAVREAEPEPAAPTGARVEAADALDAALADGAPFAAPLRAAAVASPGLAILPALAAAADGGLPTAETLANRFALRVPDMLAARHPAAGEDWQQSALDWMKSMLAVRPSEEVAGDAPEAVVSRLEAAMARHDFRTAASLFAQLPAEMRLPAADIEQQVGLRIAAEDLIAALRAPAAAGGVQ